MSTADQSPEKKNARMGLNSAKVAENRKKYGRNVLTPPAREPWWVLYLGKFKDPIIRILVVAAAVALVVGLRDGHYVEGVGIIVAILLSTGLSFFNEYRAAKEFDILNKVSDEEMVQVVRDGCHREVPRRDLVVDDIVLVEVGAEIPADCLVLEAVSLRVNESSFTGESDSVSKYPEGKGGSAGEAADLPYPPNQVLRGTTVVDGHGVLQVVTVGDKTELGKTARAASEIPGGLTPLGKQLERLASVISIGAFLAAGIIFIAQVVRGAATGEIHDLAEHGGRLLRVPLTGGQWYCFILLALALAVVCSQIWLPSLKDSLRLFGKTPRFPSWLEQAGGKGFLRFLGAAAVLYFVGVVLGLILGVLRFGDGPWLPLTAVSAVLRYFMVAVTVIVVAVPEGLPMCVTLALAYSMRKMTATNNLVRKMHACETIGAAGVICTDKTGTLTMNEMRVAQANFPFMRDGALSDGDKCADRLAESLCANSTANLNRDGGAVKALGNPTEGALLLWLDASGKDYDDIRSAFDARRQLTFTTERKFMATAGVSAVTGKPTLYVKGAPEIILARCASMRDADGAGLSPLDNAKRSAILKDAAQFQNRGMRIIALAESDVDAGFLDRPIDPDVSGLVWEGFFAIADPIREDAPAAIRAAMDAGLDVKVVTGDNQATAREIARQAGLWTDEDTKDGIITGDAFEALDDDAASEAAARIKIMSRARPLHKLRLVNLLQKRGSVVAVTGDGTNDAPALNHADVGLAMGKTGTAVAKEAADIILLDDSFSSIVNAVAWGRSLYANIQKFVVFQLTINLAAVGIALLGPFLGITLPLTVTQMLWVNLIMDTFAALALASEPPDWSLMKNRPRSSDAFIVTPAMKDAIIWTGCSFLFLFVVVITVFRGVFPMDPETLVGRHNLTLFFTCFVFMQFWNLFNARVFGSDRSAFEGLSKSRGFLAMALVILIGQVLLVRFGGEMFRVTPLSGTEWIVCLLITSPVLWVGEIIRMNARSLTDPDYWVYSNGE